MGYTSIKRKYGFHTKCQDINQTLECEDPTLDCEKKLIKWAKIRQNVPSDQFFGILI